MFSALKLGNVLYILEKGEKPVLKVGLIIGITLPNYNNYLMNSSTLDISVKVGNDNLDFKNVPSSLSVASYNNTIITETKELMSNEVDNMLLNSKSIIDNIDYHTNVISACEEILKDLNPRFAKEKERDEDISNLKNKIVGIETKMDKILTLLSSGESKI